MKYSGKSVRSLTKLMKISGDATNIRLCVRLDNIPVTTLKKLGFDETPKLGDFLLPAIIGKVTEFNVNGKEKIRKDLPKESVSIMFYGASRDWQGGINHSVRTRTMQRYPRDYIKAPSETLEVIEINKELFISSAELDLKTDETRNIHVVNLMLECFSEFELFDLENEKVIGPKLKRLQWDILPSGEYPWKKAKPIIFSKTNQLKKSDREVIEHRMKTIARKSPDFLATGRAGFQGYFVYGFKDKNVYVLESMNLDNATYVFNSEWEAISKLTKSEIINSNLPHQRIIHNKGWATLIHRAIAGN